MFEKFFKFKELNTNLRQEFIGGSTTFLTMAYIIFVQPTVLSAAGMDFGAVMVATCISSAVAILVMGFYARYPIALAPGMGQNFFFAYTVVLTMGISWQTTLGVVFIAGFIFIVLSFFGIREKIINVIPDSLKNAIAVGIGLMITLAGLEWAGLVVDHPVLLVSLGDLSEPTTQLALLGLGLTSILLINKVRGAMLIGILITTLVGVLSGLIPYEGIISSPPSLEPTLFKLDIIGALQFDLIVVIFTFLILDLFDTIGTLIGVASEADLLKDGKLPRAKNALLSDAIGTVIGAICGTSTVTSYVESAAGVASGARTGLANVFTAALFIIALFFYPLIQMIGGGVEISEGVRHYPAIAPILVLVGTYMIKGVRKIPWDDLSESIPAFITIIFIPFSFRITEGIAFGFISYTLLKLFAGKGREVPLLMWIFAVIFLLRYIFIGTN
ncbi:MAG: NCS2 family permease [Calditrichia bacterium]|nr:NCS2 family permease [Calditrichia bacterium]